MFAGLFWKKKPIFIRRQTEYKHEIPTSDWPGWRKNRLHIIWILLFYAPENNNAAAANSWGKFTPQPEFLISLFNDEYAKRFSTECSRRFSTYSLLYSSHAWFLNPTLLAADMTTLELENGRMKRFRQSGERRFGMLWVGFQSNFNAGIFRVLVSRN